MSILGNMIANREKDTDKRLDQLIKKVRNLYFKVENAEFLTYVTQLKNSESITPIKPRSFCLDVIEMILENRDDFAVSNYYAVVKTAERLYQDIFIYEERTPDFDDLSLVFLELFEEGGVIAKNVFRLNLFQTFRDKYNYIVFSNAILGEPTVRECMTQIAEYAVSVRQYFIDDMEYTYHLVHTAKKMLRMMADNRVEYLEHEKTLLQRMNGIYNIDATDLAKAENQLMQTKDVLARSMDIVAQADEKTRQLNHMLEEYAKTLHEIRDNEIDLIRAQVETLKTDLNTTYDSFVREQKDKVIFDRQGFMDEMVQETQGELERLRSAAKTIASTAALELNRVSHEAELVVRKVDDMVHSDVEVQRIINSSQQQKDFMEKVNQIQMFSESNLKTIEAMMAKELERARGNQAAGALSKAEAAEHAGEEAATYTTASTPAQGGLTVVVNGNVNAEEEILPVNVLLDENVPFQQRWAAVMAEKHKRMEMGVHYHVMFDDVLMAIMENANPYLIGPSGCGKTYMINQIASLLQLEAVDIGYINEEYDILGFQTANGGYSAPNFYRCYKYGRIAFCDELDNGNSRATVKLNSFLSNTSDARYSFPNGENVQRHPNFRIVAAGNTAGNGADVNYNTREKIEESVQQRFTPIFVDYDHEVERRILKGYPDWFDFVVLFRGATTAWGNAVMSSAPGILTTRDAVKIRKYLEHQSFSVEKILQYEFIQTKDMDYLLFLVKHMREHETEHKKAGELLKLFENMVETMRGKGGRY